MPSRNSIACPAYIIEKSDGLLVRLIRLLKGHNVGVNMKRMGNFTGKMSLHTNRRTLALNANSCPHELAQLCAQALVAVVDTNTIYLRVDMRGFIDRQPANPEFSNLCRQCEVKG